jgi:hypothetical protein
MNLGEARYEIRQRLGEDFEDFWREPHITRAVNEGLKRFAYEERWPWYRTVESFDLVADEGNIVLANNVEFNRNIDVAIQPWASSSSRDLHFPERVTPDNGWELRKLNPQLGLPRYYFLESVASGTGSMVTTLRFSPEPDRDYKGELHYFRIPADVVDESDVIDCPDQYVGAPVAWATGQLWLKELNGGGKAQEQFNLYNAVLAQAMEDFRSQPDDSPLSIGGMPPAGRDVAWRFDGGWDAYVRAITPPTLG